MQKREGHFYAEENLVVGLFESRFRITKNGEL